MKEKGMFARKVTIEGKEVLFYTLGEIARRLEIKTRSLREIERQGAMPKTPYREKHTGNRLYTEKMVELLVRAGKKAYVRNIGIRKKVFKEFINTEWSDVVNSLDDKETILEGEEVMNNVGAVSQS